MVERLFSIGAGAGAGAGEPEPAKKNIRSRSKIDRPRNTVYGGTVRGVSAAENITEAPCNQRGEGNGRFFSRGFKL